MIKTDFMKLYEELGQLNEYYSDDYFYKDKRLWSASDNSRLFWGRASVNALDDKAFHRAFDKELKELGLMDIFAEDGSIATKGSYGRIKAAKEANPDSWAVKALLKFWTLQFKNGVKLNSVIQQEKEAEARREREASAAEYRRRRDLEDKAKNEKAREDREILEKELPKIKAIVEKKATEVTESKRQQIIANIEKAVKLRAEVDANTRNMISHRDSTGAGNLPYLKKGTDLFTVEYNLPVVDERTYSISLTITLTSIFRIKPRQDFYTARWGEPKVFSYLNILPKFLEENTVESHINEWLEKIAEIAVDRLNFLDDVQEEYDLVMSKVNAAKAAQAAVDAGRPVDPKFISTVLDEFSDGIKGAERAYRLYIDVQDGSSGAAYAMAEGKAVEAIAVTLVNCNWRAYTDTKEIASWRMTESIDDLYDAVDDAFNAYKSGLHFEVVK